MEKFFKRYFWTVDLAVMAVVAFFIARTTVRAPCPSPSGATNCESREGENNAEEESSFRPKVQSGADFFARLECWRVWFGITPDAKPLLRR